MTEHCGASANKRLASEYTPLVPEGGWEVVVNLEARVGPWEIGGGHAPLEGWAYNGSVPGPTIEARQGDTLVVRLTNGLSEANDHTLARTPPASPDGWHPGRAEDRRARVESFEYRFGLPDAGTF